MSIQRRRLRGSEVELCARLAAKRARRYLTASVVCVETSSLCDPGSAANQEAHIERLEARICDLTQQLRDDADADAQVQPQLQSYSTNVGDIVGLTTTMIRDRESKWERAFSHLENEASFFCHQAAGRRLPTADNKKPILAADFLAALESELSEMFL